MHLFYLHGFASGARSSKAVFFRERLAPLGIALHTPDFNEPDFATLTVTRMLDQLDAAIAALPPGPVALIGSSLGSFVAWHATARRMQHAEAAAVPADARTHPIVALVLLAPAFEFGANRMRDLGEEGIARWKAMNRLDVFHYGYGEMRSLGYALYEDASRYNSTRVQVETPALVFQGKRDALVDPAMVERFVSSRPSMTLQLLDDDHQLLASLEHIWKHTAAFLHLHGQVSVV
jgi:pimeloyl-ACP methyl ester carboxylesterase